MNNLRMMWSSHMQRSREWKNLLMQRLSKMEGGAPKRLTYWCMMLAKMWEHPHQNAGIGGH